MSKTYLVIGASSSIGQATAQLLQKNNHQVIGISTKEQNFAFDRFYKTENYLQNLPEISEPLHGLLYLPGTIYLKPFSRFTTSEFLQDFEINALGAAVCTQFYLNNLKQVKGSSVVFISSVATRQGMPFHASIAMAKSAVEGLTSSLAAELAPSIRVNCIAPSLTDTPMANKFLNTPEKLEASEKRNPLKKVGTSNDIANMIEFLLSEKAGWISGQIISVDGGMGNLKV